MKNHATKNQRINWGNIRPIKQKTKTSLTPNKQTTKYYTKL